MERSLFKYIWQHTRRDQVWIIIITLLAMIPYYMSFDLPKQIINGPITGIGFETPGATLPFMRFQIDVPILGTVSVLPGIELERIPLLFALSLAFLALVIINGLIKVYTNTYKGRMGERLLRRIRFELIDRILRFPPRRFKSLKAGEVSSMVKDEVEPFGGFSGEAFASPVMLAGQTVTAMTFIFVQHVGLGLVALVMALIQVLIIPKLRARLIVLGRERQLNARQLAGRVGEIVEGIETIHGSDASNYVRADIVDRLGRIFKIRYDIFQWKFFVKFLNNFIAQLTPFIFYSFGGYLAIIGKVDVGQLVAVINAYKELPGPMKGLIDWDMARQDIQVKYETIVNQFDTETLIPSEILEVDAGTTSLTDRSLQIRALSLVDDSGSNTLSRATAKFDRGEAVALVGGSSSGADALAQAVARMVWPAEGAVQIGDDDILQVPESISGRRVTYASPAEYYFAGSLEENLLFGLKNAPRAAAAYEGEEAEFHNWWRQEAEITGNPALDLNDQWIDEASVLAHTGSTSISDAIQKVLGLVEANEEVSELAMRSPLDPETDADLTEMILEVRRQLAARLQERGWQDLVLPFDQNLYNDEATIAENIYFGGLTTEDALMQLGTGDFMRNIAQETGLAQALFRSGCKIAEITTNLLHDLPPEHPFFERMKLMSPEDLPEFQMILDRADPENLESLSDEERPKIMWLNAKYTEPWYRFGILTDELKDVIIKARNRIRAEIPDELSHLIEFYDREKYMFQAEIRENVIFGKINSQRLDAGERFAEIATALKEDFPDVVRRVMGVGLRFDVGPGGRRLSPGLRQKLNLARALLRDSDIYVFNRPLAGLELDQQRRIIDSVLTFLQNRSTPPLVLWVLADADNCDAFSRVVKFDEGSIVADEKGRRIVTDDAPPGEPGLAAT